jgi:membrane associated rhomboid family serine protease
VIPLRDENPTRRFAALTAVLIGLNVVVFLLVQPEPSDQLGAIRFHYERAAVPCELVTGEPLSEDEIVATVNFGQAEACEDAGGPAAFPDKSVYLAVLWSMFFHADWLHIGFNMLFLWIFGNNVEDTAGRVRYLLLYVLGGVAATAAHVAVGADSTVPIIGASGAVAAVMGIYLVWYPNAEIRTLFLFFFILVRDVQAKFLLAIWFVSQFFIGPDEGVAWAAHVGGFVFGVLAGLVFRPPRARAAVVEDSPYPWRPWE